MNKSTALIFSIFSIFLLVLSEVTSSGLREEFTWTRINYDWPTMTQTRFGGGGYRYRPVVRRPFTKWNAKDEYMPGGGFVFPGQSNGNYVQASSTTSTTTPIPEGDIDVDYIYQNNIPMGANRWGDKLFITVPRRRFGVPSTLNYVSMSSPNKHNVPLIPYPSWEMNQLSAEASQRLVSIYRVAIDPCDRLWAVDTGTIETLGNRTDIQPHSIVTIDLKTDTIINRYTIPSEHLRPATALALIQIDVTKDTCDDAYAYLPDLAGYGLIVYSLKDNKSWRVNHNYFYLEPLAGEFSIGGHNFQWNDGVFSVALSDVKQDGFRDMYFHSMAGHNLYRVSTKILKDENLATRSYHENDFELLGNRGLQSQTSASDLHQPSGVLFLSLVNQNALGCWNTNKRFTKENFDIVQKDNEKMIYPCDVKISEDDVILLTNNMPIFLYGQLDYDQTNFRVWINSVNDAISGTKCAAGRGRPNKYRG